VPRAGSGHRVADGEFFREQVGSFFAFFAGRSLAGGRAWAVLSWQEFAVGGQAPTFAVGGVPGPEERARAWREGLGAGGRALAGSARPGLGRPAQAKDYAKQASASGTAVFA